MSLSGCDLEGGCWGDLASRLIREIVVKASHCVPLRA